MWWLYTKINFMGFVSIVDHGHSMHRLVRILFDNFSQHVRGGNVLASDPIVVHPVEGIF
jgi:hypothetical protein